MNTFFTTKTEIDGYGETATFLLLHGATFAYCKKSNQWKKPQGWLLFDKNGINCVWCKSKKECIQKAYELNYHV